MPLHLISPGLFSSFVVLFCFCFIITFSHQSHCITLSPPCNHNFWTARHEIWQLIRYIVAYTTHALAINRIFSLTPLSIPRRQHAIHSTHLILWLNHFYVPIIRLLISKHDNDISYNVSTGHLLIFQHDIWIKMSRSKLKRRGSPYQKTWEDPITEGVISASTGKKLATYQGA